MRLELFWTLKAAYVWTFSPPTTMVNFEMEKEGTPSIYFAGCAEIVADVLL